MECLDKEVWIKFRDTNYEVSNHGQVRRIHKRTPPKYLKHCPAKDGYVRVDICKNGVVKHFQIHRLVAECFVPFVDGKTQVNHKDTNKLNNYYKNLEWCTTNENSSHAKANGLYADRKGEKAGGSKLKPENVLYIREHGLAKKWEYVHKFGISVQTVYDVWERKSWTHI